MPYRARSLNCICGAASCMGSVRWMPSGLTSNTHASTIAIGNPTSRKMTMAVMAHSGTCKAGSTTEAPSVTPHATAP